jgi:hypothetical protein
LREYDQQEQNNLIPYDEEDEEERVIVWIVMWYKTYKNKICTIG